MCNLQVGAAPTEMSGREDRSDTHLGAVVDWRLPPGRSDWLMGTGATRAERVTVWIATAIGVAAVLWTGSTDWAWWQWALVAVLAFDVAGGVTANALNSAKRQYHGSSARETGAARRVLTSSSLFTAAHLHPFLVVLAIPGATWAWALFWYVACTSSVLAVGRVPLYLRRPVAFAAVTTLLIAGLAVSAPAGLGWFGPVLALKLVAAHAVREEPYRPANEHRTRR